MADKPKKPKAPRCQVLFDPKVYAEMKVLALSDRRTLSSKCAELIQAAMQLPQYRELFVKAMQLPEYQKLYADESGIPKPQDLDKPDTKASTQPNPEMSPGDRANFRAASDQAYAAAADAQPDPEAKAPTAIRTEDDRTWAMKTLDIEVTSDKQADKDAREQETKKQHERKKAAEDAIHPSMEEVLPELAVLMQAMANLKS